MQGKRVLEVRRDVFRFGDGGPSSAAERSGQVQVEGGVYGPEWERVISTPCTPSNRLSLLGSSLHTEDSNCLKDGAMVILPPRISLLCRELSRESQFGVKLILTDRAEGLRKADIKG